MNTVDMKVEPPTDGAAPAYPTACSPYPYGLRFTLNQQQLEALGYEELPPAGTTVRIEAIGVVTRASSEDPDADGDIDYLCVEIQITEMGLEEEAASESEDADDDEGKRATRMYGKREKAA